MRTFEVPGPRRQFIHQNKVNFTDDDVFAFRKKQFFSLFLMLCIRGVYGDDWVKIRRHLQKAILVLEENGKLNMFGVADLAGFNDGFVRKNKIIFFVFSVALSPIKSFILFVKVK